MTERLTEEELAIFPLSTGDIAKIRQHHFPVPYRTYGSDRLMCAQADAWWPCALIQALATIDALEAENKRLREALSDVAYNTSSSVPLGQWPVDHYRDMMHRCVGIAARSLEAHGD